MAWCRKAWDLPCRIVALILRSRAARPTHTKVSQPASLHHNIIMNYLHADLISLLCHAIIRGCAIVHVACCVALTYIFCAVLCCAVLCFALLCCVMSRWQASLPYNHPGNVDCGGRGARIIHKYGRIHPATGEKKKRRTHTPHTTPRPFFSLNFP